MFEEILLRMISFGAERVQDLCQFVLILRNSVIWYDLEHIKKKRKIDDAP